VIGARAVPAEIDFVIGSVTAAPDGSTSVEDGWWRAAALEGLADGASGRKPAESAVAHGRDQLVSLAESASPLVRRGALRLLTLTGLSSRNAATRRALVAAERLVADRTAEAERRAAAIDLLALDQSTDRDALMLSVVNPREAEPVQTAAVRALARRPGVGAGRVLLSRWAEYTPAVRTAAADALLKNPARTRLLVEAIRSGLVRPWTLTFWQKRDLLMNRDADIRDSSRALLEPSHQQQRETVKRYAAALNLTGDPARGAQVFERACATCHSIAGKGGELGPDLATVRHRPPLLLLADILLPSQSIAQKYESYVVERRSGSTVAGVISAQTPTSITVRQAPGQDITISRSDIRRLTVSSQSSMPADLDKVMTPDEMADLLAYIKQH
jgi:putative heme-binding domain-containing protein